MATSIDEVELGSLSHSTSPAPEVQAVPTANPANSDTPPPAINGDKDGGESKYSISVEIGEHGATGDSESHGSPEPSSPPSRRAHSCRDGFDVTAPNLQRPLFHFNFDAMVDHRRLVTSPYLTPVQLLLFRVGCAVLFTAWLISSLANTILEDQQGLNQFGAFTWLFYYTHANLFSVFVFFLTSSIYSLFYVLQLRSLSPEELKKMQPTAINGPAPVIFQKLPQFINMITWIHAQLQCHLHTVVVIIYWGILFPGSTSSASDPFWVWLQTGQHTSTLFLSLVDFLIGRYGVTGFFQIAFDYGCVLMYIIYAFVQNALGYGFPYVPMSGSSAWIFYVAVIVMTGVFFFLYVGLQVWRDQRFRFRKQ